MQREHSRSAAWMGALLLVLAACDAAPTTGGAASSDTQVAGRPSLAEPAPTALLAGDIVDYHGRPLSGVLVTARDDVHARNVSVFTDGHGHYELPPLEPASYRLSVRIVGFELRAREVQLPAHGLDVDFNLRLAEDPHEQLPASYYYSLVDWPTPAVRGNFALACANCHQIGDPLWRKDRTPSEWDAVVARMEFRGPPLLPEARRMLVPTMMAAFASDTAPDFQLPPPPTGDAARVILREYEVDPQGRNGCHDLELGVDGRVYTEDGFVVDPDTFERRHHPLPHGAHSIERGPDGDMWITVTGVDQLVRLAVDSGELRVYEHRQIGEDKGVYPHTLRFDQQGRVWYTLTVSNHVAMFDPETESLTYHRLPGPMDWEGPTPIPVAYGLDIAPDQSVWWSQLLADRIGVLDPTSGEVRSWQTPFQGPRRLRVGPDGTVWVPAYASSALGRFDPVSESWKVYPLPTLPQGADLPYALAVNHATGHVWVTGSNSDSLIRFEPDSERFTVFPLATPGDFTREIEFDERGHVWTCAPDRGTGPEGPLSGRFIELELLERVGRCGDGEIQLGEPCDPGGGLGAEQCTPDCSWAAPAASAAE